LTCDFLFSRVTCSLLFRCWVSKFLYSVCSSIFEGRQSTSTAKSPAVVCSGSPSSSPACRKRKTATKAMKQRTAAKLSQPK